MQRLSHTTRARRAQPLTAGLLLARLTRRLTRARLHYGHGTERPSDDAAALIWHELNKKTPAREVTAGRRVSAPDVAAIEALAARRIAERMPVAYLIKRCWFAGLPFYVDQRVLIPRSPIAELIEARFAPWIEASRVRKIADIGTGSGCIAIACARAFSRARVDAVDIDPAALAVARLNIASHRLGGRVRVVRADHFEGLPRAAYDIIVSNPPYVGGRELARLPAEYRHEPRQALAGGSDGLDSVRVLLRQAAAYLRPGGILIVEVGNSEHAVRRQYGNWPLTWLQFTRGGGGVLLLYREQLLGAARRSRRRGKRQDRIKGPHVR
jgi:ribosomal protein L3 glutamine methyltransferase